MKRLCAFALALAFLFALLPAAGAEEAAFRFTRENFPRLDGSTSLVPLGQGIASVLLGESREDAADLISFNRTTQSFRNLCDGLCDLVIAAEPKGEVFTQMAQAAFPYSMEQIATEALVFVVNESNPVNSLTTQQVRDIYTGEITNWSQVGGEDAPIAAFQRNATAGSQVMMEKLVMEGTPMMEAPSAMVPGGMGELIESVRSYDNSANAIGYTVFYYASDMQMAQGLKILQIDGITPCAETLRSEAYPFLNGYYACISALAPKDSPQRRLYDWLVSEAGQALLTLEGYVPIHAPGEAPDSGEAIFTDYSRYAPNNGTPAKFTRFDCPQDHLEPRADYGLIFPYEGVQLYSSWDDGSTDYQSGSMKGFFNHQGQLITDPIYTDIYKFTLEDGDYLWVVCSEDGRCGLAAKDGSFATELCYDSIYRLGERIFASTDYEARTFRLLDRELNTVATQEDFTFDGKRFIPYYFQSGLTLCGYEDENWNAEYLLLDKENRILLETTDTVSVDEAGMIHLYDDQWRCSLYTPDMTPVALPEVGANREIGKLGQFYRVYGDAGDYIVDAQGTLFEWDYDNTDSTAGDCFQVVRNGRAKLYDDAGHLKYDDLNPEWIYLGEDVFYETSDQGLTLHKLSDGKELFLPQGSYVYKAGEVYEVSIWTDDTSSTQLVDKDLNLLPQAFGMLRMLDDLITGEQYLLANDCYGFAGEERLLTLDGQTQLFRASGSLDVMGGYISVSNDWAFTCYDMEGNVIFCYPYFGMASGD